MITPNTNAGGFQRVLRKLTKADLARVLGISRQNVHKWGDEVPEQYAVRVSAITGIPVEKILPQTWKAARQAAKARARS